LEEKLNMVGEKRIMELREGEPEDLALNVHRWSR
jgi:hypothetical protein